MSRVHPTNIAEFRRRFRQGTKGGHGNAVLDLCDEVELQTLRASAYLDIIDKVRMGVSRETVEELTRIVDDMLAKWEQAQAKRR